MAPSRFSSQVPEAEAPRFHALGPQSGHLETCEKTARFHVPHMLDIFLQPAMKNHSEVPGDPKCGRSNSKRSFESELETLLHRFSQASWEWLRSQSYREFRPHRDSAPNRSSSGSMQGCEPRRSHSSTVSRLLALPAIALSRPFCPSSQCQRR